MNGATESGREAVVLGPAVILAIFVGLGVILLTLFIKWIKQDQTDKGSAKNDKPDRIKGSSTEASGKHSKKEQASTVKGTSKNKKLTEREGRRTARANEKGFSHPWLLATLKGHTGRVLDMDYSANGKYLVSCGDDPDPGGIQPMIPSECSSSSESYKENSLPPSTNPSPVMPKGLSRRQRKNRKSHTPSSTNKPIEPSSKLDHASKRSSKKSNASSSKNAQHVEDGAMLKSANEAKYAHREVRGRVRNIVGMNLEPLADYRRMRMPEGMFVQILKDRYMLSREAMAILGYPLRPEIRMLYKKQYDIHRHPDPALLYYNYYVAAARRRHHLDVHAVEFVPRNDSGDSGNGSGSSSEEESSSGSEGVEETPRHPKLAPGIKWKDVRTHICARCGSFFYTTSKQYITKDRCSYHPGKIRTLHSAYGPIYYTCCRQPYGSPGCDRADLHVWAGLIEPIVNSSYVETEPPKDKRADNNYGIYSLDCEMSYTVSGLEVVKVTLVDISGKPVYNEFVKPVNKIVDFNTRYSGIVEEDLIRHPTKSLVQVQKDLKRFLTSETILVGHGLENDLKCLKLLHKSVVDTAFTFPHFKGLPFKRSLRSLVETCLNREIQCGTQGHDSFEDARACMELMLFRLRMDFPDSF